MFFRFNMQSYSSTFVGIDVITTISITEKWVHKGLRQYIILRPINIDVPRVISTMSVRFS